MNSHCSSSLQEAIFYSFSSNWLLNNFDTTFHLLQLLVNQAEVYERDGSTEVCHSQTDLYYLWNLVKKNSCNKDASNFSWISVISETFIVPMISIVNNLFRSFTWSEYMFFSS